MASKDSGTQEGSKEEPRPAEAANLPPRKGPIYDKHGLPTSGATAFVIFLLPFLAALATFIACFFMFWPKGPE